MANEEYSGLTYKAPNYDVILDVENLDSATVIVDFSTIINIEKFISDKDVIYGDNVLYEKIIEAHKNNIKEIKIYI